MPRPSSSGAAWIISSASTPKSAKRAKVMAIAVHPYISGVPHRIKYFERVFQQLKKQEGVRVLDRRADPRLVRPHETQGG